MLYSSGGYEWCMRSMSDFEFDDDGCTRQCAAVGRMESGKTSGDRSSIYALWEVYTVDSRCQSSSRVEGESQLRHSVSWNEVG